MIDIKTAQPSDLERLLKHDKHIRREALESSIRLGRVLMAECDGTWIGWLRWNLFWDNTPFLNMLFLFEEHRKQGYGKAMILHWEQSMREALELLFTKEI